MEKKAKLTRKKMIPSLYRILSKRWLVERGLDNAFRSSKVKAKTSNVT